MDRAKLQEVKRQVAEEWRRFTAALPALLTQYPERWVIFREGAVQGIFDDHDLAYEEAIRRFGVAGGFVLGHVSLDPTPPPIRIASFTLQ